jgi:hypothetical protein
LIVQIGYSFDMAIKSIGLDPDIGSYAAMAAVALLLIAGIDRHNELGLISDNRYQLSTNTSD